MQELASVVVTDKEVHLNKKPVAIDLLEPYISTTQWSQRVKWYINHNQHVIAIHNPVLN
jgi:hypothetical protein